VIDNDFGVAIIGAGCRFPGANSISEFWTLLCNGIDAISEIPSTRFDVDAYYDPRPGAPGRMITRCGGFLADIDKFDPYFFGISPREAAGIDPQHRLLLETAWQCVEDAGVTSPLLARARAGVFVGVCTDDYQAMGRVAADRIDVRFAMGIARSNAAGRISYLLGLTGPSLCLDTACSSSLLAIHLAVRSLRAGECELAFAGGVNAILEPTTMIAFSQGGLLSPEGRCKAFDESANGFVRSEGAGMVLLKPLRRAMADGDPIYAVIRGSATNNDGPASLFMAPSRDGQEAVLRAACADAEVSPAEIQYVEAHGTGTQVGDPIEIESLAAVMGSGRAMDAPLHVGSVKTNIGHLEGGAGVAGVIKTALILRHGFIPPNLHLQNPTPGVPWDRLPISLPRHVIRWPQGKPRLAGVSSFGISGTNVHAILEGAPPEPARETPSGAPSRPHVLLMSARDERSLTESARLWEDHLASATDDIGDICHSSATRRNHFDHRLSVVGQSRQEMMVALSSWRRGEPSPGLVAGRSAGSEWHKPVFVFSGVGSQWPRMGLTLREGYPVFRAALEQAEEWIATFARWSLLEELSRDEHSTRFGRIDIFQPASVAVQLALAQLWISWGIEPGLVIGHSVGEIPAAQVAGAISFEQAMEIAVLRSEVMHRAADTGAMLACELTPDGAARFLEGLEDRVSIGVVNGPDAVVLSGDKIILNRMAANLEHRNIFCRFVRMPVPSHSPLMEPLLAELKQRVAHIHPETARIPMISTVDSRVHHGEALTAEYWAHNLRSTVQFAGAVAAAFDRGENVFVEVSPHALLIDHLRKAGSARSRPCLALPSMRRGEDGRRVMLESLGQLHCSGYSVDWRPHERADARYVRIPGHPLRAERFWLDTSRLSAEIPRGRRHGSHAMLPDSWMPADRPSTHIWEFTVGTDEFPFLAEHAFQGHPILPGAAYCELLAAATDAVFGPGPKVFRNIQFHRSLFLDQETRANVQIVLAPEENGSVPIRFYVKSGPQAWELYFEATFLMNENSAPTRDQPLDAGRVQSRLPVVLSESEFYATAGLVGLEYGPCFRSIRKTWTDNSTESLGQVQVPDFLTAEAKRFKLHPAVFDSLFQITVAEMVKSSHGKPIMPVSLEELRMGDVCAAPEFWVHCNHHKAPEGFGSKRYRGSHSGWPCLRLSSRLALESGGANLGSL
jgi:acyl transferase domain-containing protein